MLETPAASAGASPQSGSSTCAQFSVKGVNSPYIEYFQKTYIGLNGKRKCARVVVGSVQQRNRWMILREICMTHLHDVGAFDRFYGQQGLLKPSRRSIHKYQGALEGHIRSTELSQRC